MTSSFSWSDHAHIALNTCFPCLRRSSSIDSLSPQNTLTTAASADLQRLLVDPDTLSLHSTTHVRNSGRKSAKNGSTTRGITLFGYHLFGRPPPPPIQLTTDSDDAIYSNNSPITPTLPVHSTTEFDSDAALLDTETLPRLVAPVEEEEERRARRRERKELRRLARALAADGTTAEEFEGFQGSGNSRLPPQSFLQVQVAPDDNDNYNYNQEDEDEDRGADLDGVVYTRRRPASSSGGRGSSDSRSSSYKYRSRKKKSKYTHSSSRTADSTSLASPIIPTYADITMPTIISPTTIEQGQGFFDHKDRRFAPPVSKDSFPSTGFGLRAKGGARGAFLANTGELFDGTF